MKCIVCKMCEALNAALDKKLSAQRDAQMNTQEIGRRELDNEQFVHANELLANKDYTQAFRECLSLAEQGSVWSMGVVGWAFDTGTGVPQDLLLAEKWYRRAFDGGSDYGLFWLGVLYTKQGQWEKATEVFRTGAERDWAPAMYQLARLYLQSANWRQKRNDALVLLERASVAGDLSARRFLATTMMHGWFGWRRIPAGIRMFSKVAEDMAELVKDDQTLAAKLDSGKLSGFFSRFIQRLVLGISGIPAAKVGTD